MKNFIEAWNKQKAKSLAAADAADVFRARFASIYGPKKNPRIGTQNGPGAGSEDGDGGNADGNNARTGQDAPGAGTPTGTPPDGEEAVQTHFDTNPGDPGRDGDETGPENATERLPDNGEVPPEPAERARMSQESADGSGTNEDTPGTKKPVQARKSGNGKGRGKGNAGKRGQGKAGRGRKR